MPISPYLRTLRERYGHDLLVMPAISAIVLDERGHVLLHRARETGNWHTLGGVLEPGETPATAAVREVREETGVDIAIEHLVGVYVTPEVRYGNGDRATYVVTCFRCRVLAGEPHVADDESLEVRFFPPDALPPLRPDQALRVAQAIAGRPEAWFEPAPGGG